jgi:hypothetical protein
LITVNCCGPRIVEHKKTMQDRLPNITAVYDVEPECRFIHERIRRPNGRVVVRSGKSELSKGHHVGREAL